VTQQQDTPKRHYRLTAHRIHDEHPGANVIYTYAYASSVIEAATITLRKHEKPRGLYGVGLYRIVKVEEYAYGVPHPQEQE
jgi:hypothetical protein